MSIPSYIWITLIFGLIFYVFSGGVYNSVQGNVPAYGYNRKGEITLIRWDPTLSHQYRIEGFVAAIMMFIAFLGLYMHSLATKEPHNTRRAENYQILGTILIMVSIIVIQSMIRYKKLKGEP